MAGTLDDGDGAERRPRHAHGAGRQRPAQAAGAARRQGADRSRARSPGRSRHRARRRQRALQGRPDRARTCRSGERRAIEISDERAALLDTGGGVKKALPRLGAGPFLIHNADSVWIEGVGSNLARLAGAWDDARMDCLMLLALASQATATRAAAISPWRATAASAAARRAGDGAVRVHGRVGGASAPVRRQPGRRLLAQPGVEPGRSPRVAPMACAWRACGCTSASPDALAEAERCLSGVLRARSEAQGDQGNAAARPVRRIYTVPPGRPFLTALAEALLAGNLPPRRARARAARACRRHLAAADAAGDAGAAGGFPRRRRAAARCCCRGSGRSSARARTRPCSRARSSLPAVRRRDRSRAIGEIARQLALAKLVLRWSEAERARQRAGGRHRRLRADSRPHAGAGGQAGARARPAHGRDGDRGCRLAGMRAWCPTRTPSTGRGRWRSCGSSPSTGRPTSRARARLEDAARQGPGAGPGAGSGATAPPRCARDRRRRDEQRPGRDRAAAGRGRPAQRRAGAAGARPDARRGELASDRAGASRASAVRPQEAARRAGSAARGGAGAAAAGSAPTAAAGRARSAGQRGHASGQDHRALASLHRRRPTRRQMAQAARRRRRAGGAQRRGRGGGDRAHPARGGRDAGPHGRAGHARPRAGAARRRPAGGVGLARRGLWPASRLPRPLSARCSISSSRPRPSASSRWR